MSIILLLLKIIGIILLFLLGILLLLVLLILFLPVHYLAVGTIDEQIVVRGKIHWLFHILTLEFGYDGDGQYNTLRIFGIRRKVRQDKVPEEELEHTFDREYSKIKGNKADATKKHTKEPVQDDVQQAGAKEKAMLPRKQSNNIKSSKKNRQRRSGPLKALWKRIKQALQRLKYHIKKNWYILTHIHEKMDDIKNIITDETNKKSVLGILKELKFLMKHSRFRKVRTELTFSAGNPAVTGQILGILCMLPALYRYKFHVYPDFESENVYVTGSFELRGHARIWHLLRSFIRLWKEKEFRMFVKRIIK